MKIVMILGSMAKNIISIFVSSINLHRIGLAPP